MSTPLGSHALIRHSGRAERLGQEVRDAKDRFIASDPGWARLRQGVRAVLAVGSTLLLELVLARLTGRPPLLGMLLGAVVAMLMSTGIRERHRRVIATTVGMAPLVAAFGTSLGVLTAEQHLLGLTAFVGVSFLAVWVRRFGPRGFTLGFLAWQSFFFALFLHPPVSALPSMLVAIAASAFWVGILLLTVLYDNPELKLRRIVNALRARARSGISAALGVLDEPDHPAQVRQLRRQLIQLSETALLLDGQLADPRALPDGVPPGRLRRWTVDFEIAMDAIGAATMELVAHRALVPPDTLAEVRKMLEAVAWADSRTATSSAERIRALALDCQGTVHEIAEAALQLLDTVAIWDSGALSDPATAATDSDQRADVLDEEDDFEPVVTLIGGNLPGSAAVAQQMIARKDAGRFSPSRMRLTTRQAIQAAVAAALAIIVGEAISAQRFYWAVIAAFVAYAGTATSGETLQKGASRIGGTLVGLVAAVGLANVTDGHPKIAVLSILLCIFFAFVTQAISYGTMIVFITVMLAQLYTLLGTFTDQLLLIRLAETVSGAAIGIIVSLVVLPTHSRATLRVARRNFLGGLGELLEACGATLDGTVPNRDLLTLTVTLDATGRQLVQIRRALTNGRLFGADRVGLRHRVTVLSACAANARALAAAITAGRVRDPALANAARELAIEARRLAEIPELGRPPELEAGSADVLVRVRPLLEQVGPDRNSSGPTDGALAPTVSALRRLTEALALLGRIRPSVRST